MSTDATPGVHIHFATKHAIKTESRHRARQGVKDKRSGYGQRSWRPREQRWTPAEAIAMLRFDGWQLKALAVAPCPRPILIAGARSSRDERSADEAKRPGLLWALNAPHRLGHCIYLKATSSPICP
jgi:hypothetical protein